MITPLRRRPSAQANVVPEILQLAAERILIPAGRVSFVSSLLSCLTPLTGAVIRAETHLILCCEQNDTDGESPLSS